MSKGRRRDRLVYLRSHPFLFALLSATRFAPTVRLGRTVLVHGTDAFLDGLTRVRLDRTAPGSTGGIARAAGASDLLFDEEGPEHRATRRSVGRALDVGRLAPAWRAVLRQRLQPLADNGTVDVVSVAVELTGVTTAALLNVGADAVHLALTARRTAADATRGHFTRRTPTPDAAKELVELTGSDRAA